MTLHPIPDMQPRPEKLVVNSYLIKGDHYVRTKDLVDLAKHYPETPIQDVIDKMRLAMKKAKKNG